MKSGEDTIIQAVEEIRTENHVEYVIYEDFDSNGGFIYYLRNMVEGSPILSVEYVRKTFIGKWKWFFGAGHTDSQLSLLENYEGNETAISYQYLRVANEKQFKIPHPVIFGGISDPNISRVVVKDYQTGLERQVNLINVNDWFRFYFVNVTESQGMKFDVIAFNVKNEAVYKETFDETMSSGKSGDKQE